MYINQKLECRRMRQIIQELLVIIILMLFVIQDIYKLIILKLIIMEFIKPVIHIPSELQQE